MNEPMGHSISIRPFVFIQETALLQNLVRPVISMSRYMRPARSAQCQEFVFSSPACIILGQCSLGVKNVSLCVLRLSVHPQKIRPPECYSVSLPIFLFCNCLVFENLELE